MSFTNLTADYLQLVGLRRSLVSQFLSNLAGTGGGGIYQAAGDGRIVNSLFANNLSLSYAGSALYLSPAGTVQILFTTIGASSLTNGDAVRLNSGNLTFVDNIVTNHSIGLDRFGGSVVEDYNLFYANSLNKFGAMSGGTHDVFGNPLFVNPGANGYHLQVGSAAIDAGTDAGVYEDIDGETRPQNVSFDIGFDELHIWRMDLPLILRQRCCQVLSRWAIDVMKASCISYINRAPIT